MSSSSEPSETSIPQALTRISTEIAAQGRHVEALHTLAEGLSGRDAIVLAQTIDIASQHLHSLAAVVAALGEARGADGPLPESARATIEALPLSDLRDRLLGRTDRGEGASDGEMDLF